MPELPKRLKYVFSPNVLKGGSSLINILNTSGQNFTSLYPNYSPKPALRVFATPLIKLWLYHSTAMAVRVSVTSRGDPVIYETWVVSDARCHHHRGKHMFWTLQRRPSHQLLGKHKYTRISAFLPLASNFFNFGKNLSSYALFCWCHLRFNLELARDNEYGRVR